ncbi:MAG: hypothetical protein R3250_13715, partial [Melioribacteraceae bacterium]|nr:hypothetical protein [Melioribacteraceae bacterium]
MIIEKNDFLNKWDISVFQHEAMNTLFKIFISGESKEYAEQAAQEAFNEIDLLEDTLSRYRP